MAERPTGVTILAVLALIGGLLNLFLGGYETLFGPLVGMEMAQQGAEDAAIQVGAGMTALGIAMLVTGVVQLIVSYGLFTLKGWAWMLTVIVQVVNIVLNVLRLDGANIGGPVVAILIAGAILYYLFRPHVKQAFGRT